MELLLSLKLLLLLHLALCLEDQESIHLKESFPTEGQKVFEPLVTQQMLRRLHCLQVSGTVKMVMLVVMPQPQLLQMLQPAECHFVR